MAGIKLAGAVITLLSALASANSQTETDLPSIAYASTYPVALIFKILLAQALVEVLSRLLESVLKFMDILGHVILSDRREQRISLPAQISSLKT